MVHELCDPLQEYKAEYKQKFRDEAQRTFDELTRRAGIDCNANRKTCAEIYELSDDRSRISSKISRFVYLRIFLWIAFAVPLCAGFCGFQMGDTETILWSVLGIAVSVLVIFGWVNPKINKLSGLLADMDNHIDNLKNEAWQQMAALNRLYDRRLIHRMIQSAVPWLQFDEYCSVSRVEEFVNVYDWDLSFHDSRSLIYVHTGEINGNPFAIMRTRHQVWTEKEYEGSRTVTWTERVSDSNGKYHTVSRSETLHAYVTAPYPEFIEETRLVYGNAAAPDLKFTREKNEKDYTKSLFGSWGRKRKIKKLAQDMKRDFVKLGNDDFELLFFTADRNHSQQYMLLFTPLAQQSMLNLLRDHEEGYGDDFTFVKDGKINTIISEHAQMQELEMSPDLFYNFDYDKAKDRFLTLSQELFRAVFFVFAPLIAIPEYRQNRGISAIYGRKGSALGSFWEHEVEANHLGDERFKYPDCATDCILKTQCSSSDSSPRTVYVTAYGYRAEARVTHKSVWCSNGRLYDVPVEWYEYLPVEGSGTFEPSY